MYCGLHSMYLWFSKWVAGLHLCVKRNLHGTCSNGDPYVYSSNKSCFSLGAIPYSSVIIHLLIFFLFSGAEISACCYNYPPWEGAFKGALHGWCQIFRRPMAAIRRCICHRCGHQQGVAWSGLCSLLQADVDLFIENCVENDCYDVILNRGWGAHIVGRLADSTCWVVKILLICVVSPCIFKCSPCIRMVQVKRPFS